MSDDKPIFHLVRGIPGSGKSTVARQLDCFHLEADMFFMRNGQYKWDKEYISDAHDWCFNAFCTAIDNGQDVVVSNTFCRLRDMTRYLVHAEYRGHDIIIHECCGQFQNIHNLPEDVLLNMKKNFTFVTKEYLDSIKVPNAYIRRWNDYLPESEVDDMYRGLPADNSISEKVSPQ